MQKLRYYNIIRSIKIPSLKLEFSKERNYVERHRKREKKFASVWIKLPSVERFVHRV